MKQKIGIAFVKFEMEDKRAYMFEFPANKWVKEGTTILVKDVNGIEKRAFVVDSVTFNFDYSTDVDEYNRLMMVAGIDKPTKRVIATVENIEWEDEGNDSETDKD